MERARDVYAIGAYGRSFGKRLEKSMKDLTRDAYLGVDKFHHSHMAKVLAAYMAYVPTLLYHNKAMGSTVNATDRGSQRCPRHPDRRRYTLKRGHTVISAVSSRG